MSFNDPAPGPQAPGPQAPGPQSPQQPQAPQAPPQPQSPQFPQSPQSPAGLAPQGAAGLPALSSPGKRLGASVLDTVLIFVTLFIGWIIWTLIILGRGQTPGKQILGMRAVEVATGQTVSYGKMFVREFLVKGLLFGTISFVTLGLGGLLSIWLLFDDKNQELWDKMVSTVVVDD